MAEAGIDVSKYNTLAVDQLHQLERYINGFI